MTMINSRPLPRSHRPDFWLPDLAGFEGPLYLAIADALAADISAGRLAAGIRLPTHRDLAEAVGVTVGTITRAYAEAARRGLVDGTVGRGTFVRRRHEPVASAEVIAHLDHSQSPAGVINLSVNRPAMGPQIEALRQTLGEITAAPELADWLGYTYPAGQPRHRAAGAAWLARSGLSVRPEQVVVTAGCQNAQTISLMAVTRPGDVLLTEALAYPGLTSLARHLGLELEPVAMDGEGIVPAAFDAACRGGGRRFAYLTPTVQNPTMAVMGESRRREIAAISRRHDVVVIEDDVHGFLYDGPALPPLASLIPERVLFVTSVSKSVLPALRVGYLAVPQVMVEQATEAIRVACLMAPPLMAEVVSRWILDGTAERLTRWQIEETKARVDLADRILGLQLGRSAIKPFHLWVTLDGGRRAEDVVAAARDVGVQIAGSAAFAVRRGDRLPEALRISVSGAADQATLATGLERLAPLLAAIPSRPALV